MNKSILFLKAHAKARKIVAIVGDYVIAFSIALKEEYAAQKAVFRIRNIVRQSEKAVAVGVRLVCPFSDQAISRMVWLPKSMIKDGAIAAWFWDKKIKELKSSINYSGARSLIVEI